MSRCVSLADSLLRAGLDAVASCHSASRVARALAARPSSAAIVLAVGKAARAMTDGALVSRPDLRGLVVTKDEDGTTLPPALEIMHAGHPHPDGRSVAATRRAIELCRGVSAAEEVLILISGGTSALLGGPTDGVSLEEMSALTERLLRSGATIDEMNRVRRKYGAALGGRLLRATRGRIRALIVSDVLSGDLRTIGSGPLHPDDPATDEDARLDVEVVASPATLLEATRDALAARGLHASGTLYGGSVDELVRLLAARAATLSPGEAAIVVGEPTLVVTGSGRGGRAQHTALALVPALRALGARAALALASDGSDGPTHDAGGLVHSELDEDPDALARFDSGTALERRAALVTTGSTGTNLTDVYIVARVPD